MLIQGLDTWQTYTGAIVQRYKLHLDLEQTSKGSCMQEADIAALCS